MAAALSALNMSYSSVAPPSGDTVFDPQVVAQPYTDGTFYRDFTLTLPAGPADQTVHGYTLDAHENIFGNRRHALKVQFVEPVLKNKDYKLTLTARVSVARA